MSRTPNTTLRMAAFFLAAYAAFLCDPAFGRQSLDNQWVGYVDDTANRLQTGSASVSAQDIEIDFASGDLNGDGFIDMVVARKQPFTTPGKRTNMLLMNEGGILVDRTQIYASASDVSGDQGFLTPTCDRDIAIADFNLDGRLDVVTGVALSFGDPKHIGHPRIYMNLGHNGAGGWLGLRHEDARIPQLLVYSTGLPTSANMCAIAAGDVTGDSAPDLYLVDYDNGGGDGSNDLGDRLLINDGQGYFTDVSQTQVHAGMLGSGFGNSGHIVDLNGDGWNDIIKSMAGPHHVTYNDPSQPGSLQLLHSNVYSGSSYHSGVGDLNNDGRIDFIASDDALDRVVYNKGNDALGRATWSAFIPFVFLAGGDDGFAGNSIIIDLDRDGWNDVLITDVDVDIPGCGRRMHVYHNPGGSIGQEIKLVEEREKTSGGWVGAVGMDLSDLNGSHDVAVFDIDRDGQEDIVLGRCDGTSVWMNTNIKDCQTNLGYGGPGSSFLSVCGADLSSGTQGTLQLVASPGGQTGFLFASLQSNPTHLPEVGGSLVTVPILLTIPFTVGPTGRLVLPVPGGGGLLSVFVQAVTVDSGQPLGYALSNAVEVKLLP